MGNSILALVLDRLRQEGFRADVAYPGQKFPQITGTVAAVHIGRADGMEVTVEVSIICPAAMGGTQCELEALRAAEVLRQAGAACIQAGCSYEEVSRTYLVPIHATFMTSSGEEEGSVGLGFTVYVNGQKQPNAIAFSEEELTGCQAEFVSGEAMPVGTRRGSCLWQIQLEELIPAGAAEAAEGVGNFDLRVETQLKTETYSGCDWTSIRREFTGEGLRRIRRGIALGRKEEANG